MKIYSLQELATRQCQSCDNGVPACSAADAGRQLGHLPGWTLTRAGTRIRKNWKFRDFMQGLAFFSKVAQIAEAAAHHPDLHLENYRDVWIEIWTHSIGGLSENDFILAAQIDLAAQSFSA